MVPHLITHTWIAVYYGTCIAPRQLQVWTPFLLRLLHFSSLPRGVGARGEAHMLRNLRRVTTLSATGGTIYAIHHASAQLRPVGTGSTASSFETAQLHLKVAGVAIIDEVVPAAALQRCKSTEAYRSMPMRASYAQSKLWRLSAFGRFHRVQFAEEDRQVFEQLEQLFAPLVAAFFGEDMAEVYRSELQLLTAAPKCSQEQSWHSDNRARGITIVVPLVDFTAENGATQLLPGSHALGSAPSRRLLVRDGARVATPRLGQLVAYDARTYHRGLGNSTADSRPALVFRYDRRESPPPGVGLVSAIGHTATAKALHVCTAVGVAVREALL